MNEGKKIRSDAWTHIFVFFFSFLDFISYENCAFFFIKEKSYTKEESNMNKKKADSLWLKAHHKRMNKKKTVEQRKKKLTKNDALVLSASINAFKTKIYGVCE